MKYTFLALLLLQIPLQSFAEGHDLYRSELHRNPYDQSPLAGFAKGIGNVENANLQAHDMTIAYLGFLYHGQVEEAKIAYNTLMKQHPQCPYVERTSPTRLKRNCPDCRGGVSKSSICSSCKGTNICPRCKGSKRVKRISSMKQICPTCNGTGRCTKCDRKGRVNTACRTCGGANRIWNKERIMLFYKKLLSADLADIERGNWARLRIRQTERPEE